MHWVLVVAYMKESKLCFYDSFLSEGKVEMKNIFRYLKDAHKRQGKTLNEDNWELVRGIGPWQGNGETRTLVPSRCWGHTLGLILPC